MENDDIAVLLATVRETNAAIKALAADVTGMRAELAQVAEAVEVVAVEQARLADAMGRTNARVSRVEHANADLWQAIDALRPAH